MRARHVVLLALTLACDHSDSFTYASTVGPSGTGSDIQLTFNSDQDYWPVLTEDGTGVLYSFVDASQRLPSYRHRCMGLMPVLGGTRSWEYCDNRFSQADSISSFPAYALGADGRLLYVESSARNLNPFAVPSTALWLADSAHPYRRRALLTFPVVVGDNQVTALADLHWTGSQEFLALAQRWAISVHCMVCTTVDSIFYGESVVRGTITTGGASLAAVPGTVGASGYAVADDGATIVFIQRDRTSLMSVPAVGDGPTRMIPVTARPGVQLTGVSCLHSTCVVAVAGITLWRPPESYASIGGPSDLVSVSLVSGATAIVASRPGVLSSPLLLASGDVIVQVGNMGHLQTFSTTSDLRLYRGVVH